MSRYIDADALLAKQETIELPDPYGGEYHIDIVHSYDVKNAPTADVVEVRHGHWIEHIEKPDWLEDDVEVFYNCSECGTSHWSISPPYCPNCGAKMDCERKEK